MSLNVITPTLGLALGRAAALLIVDGLGWRVVAAMFDRERARMSATLKLTRKAPVMEVIHRGTFDVLVDGKRVGSIESDGDTIETPVAPGRHTLQIREGRYSSRELSCQVADGQVISFRCHGRRITPIFLMSFAVPRWALKLRPE
jgi:hypothetical protein